MISGQVVLIDVVQTVVMGKKIIIIMMMIWAPPLPSTPQISDCFDN